MLQNAAALCCWEVRWRRVVLLCMGGQCIGGLSSHAKDRFIKLNLSLVHCPSTVQGIHRLFPGAFSDFWTLWIPASSLWSAWMMLLRDIYLLESGLYVRHWDLALTRESGILSELLPAACSYFNTPRTSGEEEVQRVIFKKKDFKCKLWFLEFSSSSLELTCFEVNHSNSVIIAVIYRPSKYNKNFINYLSELRAGTLPNYDHVFIVGGFNIHVCCPDKPLVKGFLSLTLLIWSSPYPVPHTNTETH